jgi:ammonium transporter, Amt family
VFRSYSIRLVQHPFVQGTKELTLMIIWLVMLAVGTLLLRVGFALHGSGGLRAKNGAGQVLRITVDTVVSTLAFWAIGAAILLQSSNGIFGVDHHLLFNGGEDPSVEFFSLAIVLIGGAIISGALAERAKFYAGIVAAAVFAAVVIPIAGHWAWYGWLMNRGFVDAGGASVIHLSAAVCAAVGALFAGARQGKYNKDGSSNSIPGHSLPLNTVGILVLLVGWMPYMMGSVLVHPVAIQVGGEGVVAVVAMNVMLAAAGGALAGMVYGQFRYRKADIFFIYSGLLGGLVAITAGAGVFGNVGALLTGMVAGLLVPLLTLEIDMRFHLDDPLGVVAIHGIGGLWGTLAVAIFAHGSLEDRLKLLVVQVMGIASIIALAAVVSGIVFVLLKMANAIRVTEADEFDGLDLGEHDINGYPDFQQTTIKSYHLREA